MLPDNLTFNCPKTIKKATSQSGHALGNWICGRSLFWASKSVGAHSIKSLKISGCKRWCPKDLRVCAPAAPVLTHSLYGIGSHHLQENHFENTKIDNVTVTNLYASLVQNTVIQCLWISGFASSLPYDPLQVGQTHHLGTYIVLKMGWKQVWLKGRLRKYIKALFLSTLEIWWALSLQYVERTLHFLLLQTNALSFYRSQNVLCRSKFFVSDQNFIDILACFIYFSQKFFCTMGDRNFCAP